MAHLQHVVIAVVAGVVSTYVPTCGVASSHVTDRRELLHPVCGLRMVAVKNPTNRQAVFSSAWSTRASLAQRADLTPVYCMIFRRLKARGYDWTYHFPKLELVDLRPLRDALREQEGEGWNQGASVPEDEERDRSLHELRESLDTAHREAVAAARDQSPPATVQAYQSVYDHFPAGWPPVEWC